MLGQAYMQRHLAKKSIDRRRSWPPSDTWINNHHNKWADDVDMYAETQIHFQNIAFATPSKESFKIPVKRHGSDIEATLNDIWEQFESNLKAISKHCESILKTMWKQFGSDLKASSMRFESNLKAIWKEFEKRLEAKLKGISTIWKQFWRGFEAVLLSWKRVGVHECLGKSRRPFTLPPPGFSMWP